MIHPYHSRGRKFKRILGAVLVGIGLASWAYFAEAWRGIVVHGADDVTANGYYRWDTSLYKREFAKAAERDPSWRVPSAFDLLSRRPLILQDQSGVSTAVIKKVYGQLLQHSNAWFLIKGKIPEYYALSTDEVLGNTPPTDGWRTVEPPQNVLVAPETTAPKRAGSAPELKTCGKQAPQDDMGVPPPVVRGEAAEVMKYPATSLVLIVNLAYAYYLWAKKVSPDAVAISFNLFWEEQQYWRLFTASFSHFEPLHLIFNAMGIWNTRKLERALGSFKYLFMTLNLVVATIMLLLVIKYFILRWGGPERQRQGKAVGFSCVLFAYMTYLAVAMGSYCPFGPGSAELCFKTYFVPMPRGVPHLPLNLGPFGNLILAQVIMPRAAFIGHLTGILTGYLLVWGTLDAVSPPILMGLSVVFMLQHSQAWARKMPDFSLLLQSWASGDTGRVARARRLKWIFQAHVLLTVVFLCLFNWGSGVGEVLALVVGFNAVQAFKCCCCPDSVQAEHRFCLKLLKAYGALSAILAVNDVMSLGAILGQLCFVSWSGVSEFHRNCGVLLLAVAAVVHVMAMLACIEGITIFREGQDFLSSIGLGPAVTGYSSHAGFSGGSRGAGRMLGSAEPTGVTPSRTHSSHRGRSLNGLSQQLSDVRRAASARGARAGRAGADLADGDEESVAPLLSRRDVASDVPSEVNL